MQVCSYAGTDWKTRPCYVLVCRFYYQRSQPSRPSHNFMSSWPVIVRNSGNTKSEISRNKQPGRLGWLSSSKIAAFAHSIAAAWVIGGSKARFITFWLFQASSVLSAQVCITAYHGMWTVWKERNLLKLLRFQLVAKHKVMYVLGSVKCLSGPISYK